MDDIPGADERRRGQERICKEYPDLYYYAAGVALVVALMIAGYALFPDRDGYLTNLFTEAASVAVTLVILNRMAEARERRRYKQDLIYRMGSRVNSEAIRAVEELRRHGWLKDGSLKSMVFLEARLERSNLQDANLSYTDLTLANLSYANLIEANLSNASLLFAELFKADLQGANLSNTVLWHASLEDAVLAGATLPNGDIWHPGYDITVFTKPPDWNTLHKKRKVAT